MSSYDYNDRKTYNNRPLIAGYVIVPIFVTWEMVNYYQMDRNNLETWTVKGHKILVAFDMVTEDRKENAMKVFWKDVRDNIKMNQYNPLLTSYEALTESGSGDRYEEDKAFEPDPVPSLERTVLLAQIIAELIEEVRALDPECGYILDLIKEGKANKEIIEELGYGASYGYTRIKDAHKTAKRLYDQD